MGREIRRVPPNWEHPRGPDGRYIPMCDEDYETAGKKWLADCIAWENGTHENLIEEPSLKDEYPFYWDWEGSPPDEERYTKFTTEPTWYQVYETVSEGTPVTPPFATKEELVNYLVENGDFWDQRRVAEGRELPPAGWTRQNAESFVEEEWAPSLMVVQTDAGTTVKEPRDMGTHD